MSWWPGSSSSQLQLQAASKPPPARNSLELSSSASARVWSVTRRQRSHHPVSHARLDVLLQLQHQHQHLPQQPQPQHQHQPQPQHQHPPGPKQAPWYGPKTIRRSATLDEQSLLLRKGPSSSHSLCALLPSAHEGPAQPGPASQPSCDVRGKHAWDVQRFAGAEGQPQQPQQRSSLPLLPLQRPQQASLARAGTPQARLAASLPPAPSPPEGQELRPDDERWCSTPHQASGASPLDHVQDVPPCPAPSTGRAHAHPFARTLCDARLSEERRRCGVGCQQGAAAPGSRAPSAPCQGQEASGSCGQPSPCAWHAPFQCGGRRQWPSSAGHSSVSAGTGALSSPQCLMKLPRSEQGASSPLPLQPQAQAQQQQQQRPESPTPHTTGHLHAGSSSSPCVRGSGSSATAVLLGNPAPFHSSTSPALPHSSSSGSSLLTRDPAQSLEARMQANMVLRPPQKVHAARRPHGPGGRPMRAPLCLWPTVAQKGGRGCWACKPAAAGVCVRVPMQSAGQPCRDVLAEL